MNDHETHDLPDQYSGSGGRSMDKNDLKGNLFLGSDSW